MRIARRTQKCRVPRDEGPVDPGVAVAATVYPTDAKHRPDHRNPGTGEVVATEREGGNPMAMALLAPAVGFRQAVGPK